MTPEFAAAAESLHPSFLQLVACQPRLYGRPGARLPDQGVYLFSEEGRHLYVGRSNAMADRRGAHYRPSSGPGAATFAFLLARRETGFVTAVYAKNHDENRDGLMKNPVFLAAFDRAKDRIRAMEYRWVEETDQTRQALLEIYAAVSLATPYNDFATH